MSTKKWAVILAWKISKKYFWGWTGISGYGSHFYNFVIFKTTHYLIKYAQSKSDWVVKWTEPIYRTQFSQPLISDSAAPDYKILGQTSNSVQVTISLDPHF